MVTVDPITRKFTGKPKLPNKCLSCQKEFEYFQCKPKKFCGHPCYWISLKSKRGTLHHNWNGGYAHKMHRRKNIPGRHTPLEWEVLKKNLMYMCLYCKQIEPNIKLTKDHIIPISKGGSDYIENIQPLCIVCNSKKGTQSTNFMINITNQLNQPIL